MPISFCFVEAPVRAVVIDTDGRVRLFVGLSCVMPRASLSFCLVASQIWPSNKVRTFSPAAPCRYENAVRYICVQPIHHWCHAHDERRAACPQDRTYR